MLFCWFRLSVSRSECPLAWQSEWPRTSDYALFLWPSKYLIWMVQTNFHYRDLWSEQSRKQLQWHIIVLELSLNSFLSSWRWIWSIFRASVILFFRFKMSKSKFISNTAVLSEWYTIATKPEHRKYQHALILSYFFLQTLWEEIPYLQSSLLEKIQWVTLCLSDKAFDCSGPNALYPAALRSLCHSCLGKEMTATFKPAVCCSKLWHV